MDELHAALDDQTGAGHGVGADADEALAEIVAAHVGADLIVAPEQLLDALGLAVQLLALAQAGQDGEGNAHTALLDGSVVADAIGEGDLVQRLLLIGAAHIAQRDQILLAQVQLGAAGNALIAAEVQDDVAQTLVALEVVQQDLVVVVLLKIVL